MSRIIYSDAFLPQVLLFGTLKTKHDNDGVASPLIPYLTEHSIDLNADNTAKGDAMTQETKRFLFSKQSENYHQLRDTHFDPVMAHTRRYFQYLKSFYKPNVSQLGDWGAPITANGKINYPPEFPQLTMVFENLRTKYLSYAPSPTPLDPFLTEHSLTIAADWTETGDARDFHEKFLQASKDSEKATEDRDNDWNPVMEHVRGIGDYLMNLYPNNTKKLGDWGFTVDNSKRAPKLRTTKVKPASQVTVNGIIVGGTLTNLGTVDLHVYKGKTTSGNPAIVHPGEKFGTIKGYSVLTVTNPDSTTTGVFNALTSQ